MSQAWGESLDAALAARPHDRFLGITAGDGDEPSYVLPASDDLIGDDSGPTIHGGVLAAFLEAAAVLHFSVVEHVEVESIDFTTDFLRPATIVATEARVSVVRRGRRFAQVTVEAWQDDQSRPVVRGHGTLAIAASH